MDSFLLGLRRFLDFEMADDELMRETKEECLMRRLSRFVERKESETAASGRNVFWGWRGWIWPVMRCFEYDRR